MDTPSLAVRRPPMILPTRPDPQPATPVGRGYRVICRYPNRPTCAAPRAVARPGGICPDEVLMRAHRPGAGPAPDGPREVDTPTPALASPAASSGSMRSPGEVARLLQRAGRVGRMTRSTPLGPMLSRLGVAGLRVAGRAGAGA